MATISIEDYKIKLSDQFIFDTNIWLLLFGTFANYQKKDQKLYSDFLNKLIIKDSPIFITSMILSEFANVLLRHDFKQWEIDNNIANQNFKKDFVGTRDYSNSINVIKQTINKILSLSNLFKAPDSFHNINLEVILENFGKVDYNDSYIAYLSQKNNYKIVTNDKDFKILSHSIDIITTQV